LGRIEAIEEADDPMLARASFLGGEHEARALENYKTTYADGVVEIETEDARADPDILREAQQRTIQAKLTSPRTRLAPHAGESTQLFRPAYAAESLRLHSILRPGDIHDAHLLALAISHGLRIASHDTGFARLPTTRWFDPLADRNGNRSIAATE
jgi:predicted nucleic acid-binding protein